MTNFTPIDGNTELMEEICEQTQGEFIMFRQSDWKLPVHLLHTRNEATVKGIKVPADIYLAAYKKAGLRSGVYYITKISKETIGSLNDRLNQVGEKAYGRKLESYLHLLPTMTLPKRHITYLLYTNQAQLRFEDKRDESIVQQIIRISKNKPRLPGNKTLDTLFQGHICAVASKPDGKIELCCIPDEEVDRFLKQLHHCRAIARLERWKTRKGRVTQVVKTGLVKVAQNCKFPIKKRSQEAKDRTSL